MVEIISKCKEGGLVLCDHATSLLQVVASNIPNICLTQANESMHMGIIFNKMEDGLENSIS
jgi:hypothetical protein